MDESTTKSLLEYHFPRWDDLPDFDLYMDQVVFYVDQQLRPLYFNNEKIITSSMVNNYVKNSIVKAPEKKRYSRKHIAYLIIICLFKKTFSLTEITKFIDIQVSMKQSNLMEAYNSFAEIFDRALKEKITTHYLAQEERDTPHKLLMDSVIQTLVCKIYTEYAVLDEIFNGKR